MDPLVSRGPHRKAGHPPVSKTELKGLRPPLSWHQYPGAALITGLHESGMMQRGPPGIIDQRSVVFAFMKVASTRVRIYWLLASKLEIA